MAPPIAAQTLTVLKILMNKNNSEEGQKKIETLARNTRYVRQRLHQMGVIVYGNENSPVIPILVCYCSKIAYIVRSMVKKGVAIVGVGYPATELYRSRIRVCLSAAHTKEQLDYALDVIEQIANEAGLKYSRKPRILEKINYNSI